MGEWEELVQIIVEEVDKCIKKHTDETLTLSCLAHKLGYSESYISRKFREISGMHFRDYLRHRTLAFALKDIRDTSRGLLEIALEHGFSSHEAFSRSFKEAYGITPSDYRSDPVPVVLRTIIKPFDCYLVSIGGTNMAKTQNDVKVYFVTIPAHKYLHIRNYESNGYWDFWQKQNQIPGQDCATICGLLDSIKGKLDDMGGTDANSGSGQIMAYINEPTGRICSWGIPRAESYGVRLPADYCGEIPEQMQIMDVPEGEYIVFEHGPFDFQTQNCNVEQEIEDAMKNYDYAASGYCLDTTQGRVFYFYHDPERFWKYIRPVKKLKKEI
ncbi:helix-turn-helix transcriptional regulator [Ruminococcus sp. Marseille-P6503]|uniref:helix-turn-helix transcriptional regulator n=1 Tax=Ruminococcus sp. Marseille-P6503 TaxID=2364796 RepID=UPI000F5467CE|nr:helix-turn-helix transcriptional regulator [Ruminococcus sp. Marseille-P6503]